MSARVRSIRRLIMSGSPSRGPALKTALEQIGLQAGQPEDPHSMLNLQRIIFNPGRDSEERLVAALEGLNLTGGGEGIGEIPRIRNALLLSKDKSALREAIDDLIAFEDSGISLSADAGFFVFTGTATSLERGREVAADAGSFSFTGTAATLIAPITTSFANPGGTGDRTASITVTSTATLGTGSNSMLVNGALANEYWWNGGQSSRQVVFDFGSGAKKYINEVKFYQDVGSGAVNQGTWLMEASDDDVSYTTFSPSFVWGDENTGDTNPFTNTNTAGNRYYRLRQTAGVTSSTPFIREVEFKIADV